MPRRMGYRYRRPRVLVTALGRSLVTLAVLIGFGELLDDLTWHHGPVAVLTLIPAGLLVAALWPVRVLEITPNVLRFRQRDFRAAGRWEDRIAALLTVRWESMVEVLIAPHGDRLTLIAGYRDVSGALRSGVVDLPAADEQAITDALRRAAPAVPVQQGRLSDVMLRTRQSYVIAHRRMRGWALVQTLGTVAGIGIGLLLYALGAPGTSAMIAVTVCMCTAEGVARVPRLVISPDRIVVTTWRGNHTLRWQTIDHVRLAATRNSVQLTVSTGFPARWTGAFRLPRPADLGVVDAMTRAYALPHALGAPLPVE